MGVTGEVRPPHRFRRRLTAAFVLVAAVAGGVVASVTFVLAREYRWLNLRSQTVEEARVALALAPARLDESSFARLQALYEPRAGADMVVVAGSDTFSSSPAYGAGDIPEELVPGTAAEPATAKVRIAGQSTLVVAATGPGRNDYYFLFSLEQLEQSLSELARVALAAWAVTVGGAGLVGQVVARATLRPVADVARAAQAVAAGDLGARLPTTGSDEFGALAASFNNMADEVQRLVTQLRDAAARERRFTADVAHELRTPLTGLSATASVLEEMIGDLPPTARRAATVLVADVRRVRDLVVELLELARLDSGADTVTAEPLRAHDAVKAVVASTENRRQAGIAIDVAPDLEVLAEPARLRRIFGNLIDNAVLHGAEPVQVRAHREGPAVVIEVADTGAGIAPDDLTRLFDRFYKSDEARAQTGSGLGLAIAREHARALGGEVWAGNNDSGGASFFVRLPAAAPSA